MKRGMVDVNSESGNWIGGAGIAFDEWEERIEDSKRLWELRQSRRGKEKREIRKAYMHIPILGE